MILQELQYEYFNICFVVIHVRLHFETPLTSICICVCDWNYNVVCIPILIVS